jgi:arginyl-tRNA synthetase
MVALSPKSLKELALKLPEEDSGKSFVEVSGRKGLGVKADDLLDMLENKAYKEVNSRNSSLPEMQKTNLSRMISTGALRYFMLKFTKNSIIIFDFEEALSFEGETGPYLQYSLVRINSIFRKLKEREMFSRKNLDNLALSGKVSLEELEEPEASDFWDLVFYASQIEEEILHSIRSLEFSHLAKFSFNLCQKFNAYYHKYPVIAEIHPEKKNIRILTIHYIREILKKSFNLMGIPQPEKM